MNKKRFTGKLIDNMAFEMTIDGHKFIVDTDEEFGGRNLGPRPKQLLLAGLIGCTGMDVVSILRKMQVQFDDLEIKAEADSATEHPRVYRNIHLTYIVKGKDIPEDKVKKAVALSQEKYCPVSAMLKKATPVTYDIVIKNG